jgi:4-hydroxy-tetrahydrodipicolinate synthase
MNLSGTWTALITPFNEEGHIDYSSLSSIIRYQIEGDITGIVLFGTTGEGPTLLYNEKIDIIKFVIDNFPKLRLIVGVGGNNTLKVVNFCESIKHFNIEAYMVTVPNYNKPTQEGIYQHFSYISKKTVTPILIYNIPSRCGVNLQVNTLKRLVNDCPNIVAIKDASGDIQQTMEILKDIPTIQVLAGDDFNILTTISFGGKGVISVLSNALPLHISSLVNMCLQNNIRDGRVMHFNLFNLMKCLFVQTNPIPIKALLNDLQIISTRTMRLPLVELKDVDLSNKMLYYIKIILDKPNLDI